MRENSNKEPAAGKMQRSSEIATFRARWLALRVEHEKAAARSPAEKAEAQNTSHSERQKFAPAV
jgi:hypothetical protein